MVIFHSYVKLPEGKLYVISIPFPHGSLTIPQCAKSWPVGPVGTQVQLGKTEWGMNQQQQRRRQQQQQQRRQQQRQQRQRQQQQQKGYNEEISETSSKNKIWPTIDSTWW